MLTQIDVFRVFGHISVFYSTWDTMIGYFLHKIVNEEYKAKNLPPKKNSTIGQKLDLIDNLNENDVNSTSSLNFVRGFLKDAKVISRLRNRYIHDNWLFKPEDLAIGKISRMTFYIDSDWKYTADEKVYYDMNELQELLTKLGNMQDNFSKAADLI